MPRSIGRALRAAVILPVALLSAVPSIRWCSGPWTPMTQDAFAACLLSEYSGCEAEVDCPAGSCASETPAASEAPSCSASLACGMTEPGADGTCEPPGPAPGRAFCVGGPSGGTGTPVSAPDLHGPDAANLAAAILALAPPEPAPCERPTPDDDAPEVAAPPESAPIRGPPSA